MLKHRHPKGTPEGASKVDLKLGAKGDQKGDPKRDLKGDPKGDPRKSFNKIMYSIVKDSSADLGVNSKIVQIRPTVKTVSTKISIN